MDITKFNKLQAVFESRIHLFKERIESEFLLAESYKTISELMVGELNMQDATNPYNDILDAFLDEHDHWNTREIYKAKGTEKHFRYGAEALDIFFEMVEDLDTSTEDEKQFIMRGWARVIEKQELMMQELGLEDMIM